MKVNGFGELTIETADDWGACEPLQDHQWDEIYAMVQETGDDDPNGQWHAEIMENKGGDTVCFVRAFATKEEVVQFIRENAPELEIQNFS